MAPRKKSDAQSQKQRRPPTTPEERENYMIALAMNAAEKQLRDGSASSQLITHYLKLGSSREELEQARLRGEIRLSDKKVDVIESGERTEELYSKAIEAMQEYKGYTQDKSYDD